MIEPIDPLGVLLPSPRRRPAAAAPSQLPDPIATALANTSQPRGLVPSDIPGELAEDDSWPATQPAAQPASADPTGAVNPINAPPAATDAPSGQWSSWLSEPANRSFMLSFGLQLMSGGWGNWGQQLAQAIGAGASAASEQQRRDAAAAGQSVEPVGRRAGRRRIAGAAPTARQPAAAQPDPQLAAVEQFIAGNPSPEQWAVANQPGGLVYAVFGGPQDQARSQELLQLVQQQTQQQQQPRRGRTPFPTTNNEARAFPIEELIELGSSRNPADIATFQQIARAKFGSPGVANEWAIDPQTGRIRAIPREELARVRGAGGRGGSVREAVQAAGIGSARVAINSLREYVRGQIGGPVEGGPEVGMIPRAVGQMTGAGDYWRNASAVRDAIASYMHARSGQTVTNREMDRYLDLYMPGYGSSSRDIYFKLAMLELNTSILGRALGDTSITNEMLLNAYNEARRNSGHQEIRMDEFLRLLPNIQQEALARAPAGMRFAPPGQPAPSGVGRPIPLVPVNPPPANPLQVTPAPPTAGPESLQQRPTGATGSRDNPHVVTSPEEAARVPTGQWFRAPDGRVLQRR